ncbi:MAG: DMT family transporter [Pseudomonadota bacterium]
MRNLARDRSLYFGIFLIVATALTISVQDLVFKLFSSDLTLWQIFTLRGFIAIAMLVAVAALRGQFRSVLPAAFTLWSLLRGLCLTITFLAFYAALPFLSLSTVGAANYVAPIFVAILSAFVIGERVTPLGWVGVLIGFVGVITLLQPGTDAFSAFAVLPVMGAAFYAVGHIITRTRAQALPTAALALSLNAMMCVAGSLISIGLVFWHPNPALVADYPYLIGGWTALVPADWLFLGILAAFAVAIGMMLSAAYQIAPPATVATFEYSYLVFVALWDALIFGEVPTYVSVAGMVLIVISGLLAMHRRV